MSAFVLVACAIIAQKPTAFVGARILTAADAVYDPGVMIVQNDKIAAIGKEGEVAIPADAVRFDAKGFTIIPGLVDTHSHIGLFGRFGGGGDGNEMTGPVQSGGRAIDAVNPLEPSIMMANAGGVTTANIMPGSGNTIGGQTIYVKLRGDTVEAMRIDADGVLGGLKMANGENPKRAYGGKGKAPFTRMKTAALQRAEFVKAKEYQAKWARYRQKVAAGSKDEAPPERNIDLEPLVEVLERKRTVHFHSHRADDIMTAVRLSDEFGFELVIQHGTEAYKVADELAKRNIPVSMTVVDSPGGKVEVLGLTERCGMELVKRGVKVIINTDDPITDSRFLMRTAATAVRGGLSPELALKAITKHPAEAMHLGKRLGTLEAGKDADFVLLTGDPFSVYTRVQGTWIDGRRVFDAGRADQRVYQFGGFALPTAKRPPAPAVVADRPANVAGRGFEVPAAAPKPNESSTDVCVYAKRVHTVTKGTIEDGVVVVEKGRISFVGKRADFRRPLGMAILSASDVTPGLVDTLSQVPLSGQLNVPADQDQDEASSPVQPELRVLDAFNPREPQLAFLRSQGITVIHACPGRANVIAGQTGVFRTFGATAEKSAVKAPFGVLVNLGESVKNQPQQGQQPQGNKPGTRMGSAGLIRMAFAAAVDYERKLKTAPAEKRPDRNLGHEAVGQILDGKLRAVFAGQRADDLNTALRIAEEFKIKPILALASEGYLTVGSLAASKAPVIVHPTMQTPGGVENLHTYLGNAAVLANRGVLVSIASGMESYVPKTRVARYEAGVAMNYGLGWQRALKSITLDAAEILQVADRFGSLDVGKEGDLVLYDGDPFEYTTHVERVIVGGALAYDRAEELAVPFNRLVFLGGGPDPGCCLGF